MVFLGLFLAWLAPTPDPQAMVVLQEHRWWYLAQAHNFSREEICRLDPWAQASWWPDANASPPTTPLWGALWDEQDRLQQILPGSALDNAGITEDNWLGIVDAQGVLRPVRRTYLRDRESAILVRREPIPSSNGGPTSFRTTSRLVAKAVWQPPTLWLGEDGRVRAYFIDRNSAAVWLRLTGISHGVREISGLSPTCKTRVLDLRGCRGGYIEVALQILGTFLGPDRLVARSRSVDEFARVRVSPLTTSPTAVKTLEPTDWTVLVDRHTASAGELLAMALQYYGARVVGGPTFGKHSIQTEITLPNGRWMRFTVGLFEKL